MLWGICLVGYYIFNNSVFHVSRLLLCLLLKRLSWVQLLTNIWAQLLCCLLFIGFYLSSSLWIQRRGCRSVSFLLQLKHSGVEDQPRWCGYPDLFSWSDKLQVHVLIFKKYLSACHDDYFYLKTNCPGTSSDKQFIIIISMIFSWGNLRCLCATERLPFKINLSFSFPVIYNNIQC